MIKEPCDIASNCLNLKNAEKPACTLHKKYRCMAEQESLITTKILNSPPFLSQVQFFIDCTLTMNLDIYKSWNSLKNNVIIKYAHYLERFQNIQIFLFE